MNHETTMKAGYVLWKTWKEGDKQYVRYLSLDSDGHPDYETSIERAKVWKTRRGAQAWLDRRGGYGSYTVTAVSE